MAPCGTCSPPVPKHPVCERPGCPAHPCGGWEVGNSPSAALLAGAWPAAQQLVFLRVAAELGSCPPPFLTCFSFLLFFFHLEQKQLSQAETYCGLIASRQLHLRDTEGQQGVCPPGDGGPWLTAVASSPQISLSGISMAPAPSKPKAPTVTCTCDLLPCFGTLFARIPTN